MYTRAKPRKPGTPPSLTVKTVSLRPLQPTRPRVLLGLLCMAQFVLVLDTAVVAVATPSIQADLEVAPTDPQAGERPLRRLDPGRLGGGARPVALEACGHAGQQVARGRVAVIGQRVGHIARGEGGLADGLGQLASSTWKISSPSSM